MVFLRFSKHSGGPLQWGKITSEPRYFWVIVKPDTANEICFIDPGHNVDLFITAPLRTMAAIFFGRRQLIDELSDGKIELHGASVLQRSIQKWMKLSSYSGESAVK